MNGGNFKSTIELDRAHCWHPFTRQDDWCDPADEPLVLVRGEGSWLYDAHDRKYLDGNSSIWTNIHGHCHPAINQAICDQLERVAHTSFLGFTHPLAAELAARLCGLLPNSGLERVFFSDDGSTAIECALKMALQFRRLSGESSRDTVIAFSEAYHGDTLGAASLSGVGRFSENSRNGFKVRHVASLAELHEIDSAPIAAVVIEPMIQGVNEMRVWPAGMLAGLREWCDETGVHLILDEVMTGFGRTGKMFACQHEAVSPDFLCLAKGLTGGYLPLAATMTTEKVYAAFLGGAENTFYYGHSYTANALGCAAAIASLNLFDTEATLAHLQGKIQHLAAGLGEIASRQPTIFETRQCGFIAGIELRNPNGVRFPVDGRMGERVCRSARNHGLLTRPILDTIVLMLPLSSSILEIDMALNALDKAISASVPAS